MILVIDVGNTHTVFGCVNKKDEIIHTMRLVTDRSETEFGYASKIKDLLEIGGIEKDEITGVIISSVVPLVTASLKKASKLLFKLEAKVVGENVKTGLDILLEGGIAPDLEVAAVAAKEDYPLPCIIADLGTATTVTVVNKEGAYIGGAILPGVGISINALVDSTSLLPGIAIEKPSKAIATETTDAMKSGIVYGSAGALDGIIDHFIEEMGQEPASIVATGGIGGLIAPVCRHDIVIDDNLLLKGLIKIYKMNN